MIPLSQRSLDPETCVQQGGHCFATHTTGPAQREEYSRGMARKIIEVCRHCPAYRVGFQPERNWVDWGEVQVRGGRAPRDG